MNPASRPIAAGAARAALFIALALRSFPSAAETGPAASPPPPVAAADTQAARDRLAKLQSPSEYAATLDSLSATLSPSEALSLIDQSLASSGVLRSGGGDYLPSFLVKAGDFALLLGLFDEAASHYLEAAPLADKTGVGAGAEALPDGTSLLLRAARCDLAAGDSERALDLSSRIALETKDADLSAASRLVGAWALALQGRGAEARSAASAVARSAPPERKREALFVIWLCAVDDKSSTNDKSSTEGKPATVDEKAEAAANLAAEFPGSPEALIASGAASVPPLPHWYLGGLQTVAAAAPIAPTQAAAAARSALPGQGPNSSAEPSDHRKRLQVGYFSVEVDARTLMNELASKGFSAAVESRMHAQGPGKDAEERWIVAVDGGKDIVKTIQALKNAGYESYIID